VEKTTLVAWVGAEPLFLAYLGIDSAQGWAITPNGVRRKLRYVTVIYGFHRNLGI